MLQTGIGMPELNQPHGVMIAHLYYPGFLDLPTFCFFIVVGDDFRGTVEIISHVRPLVVTDFDNSLYRSVDDLGHTFTRIRRPVLDVDDDAFVIDARGHEGRSGPVIAVEKRKEGRVFHQEIFTELHVAWECQVPQDAQILTPYAKILERFITTYRYLYPDLRLTIDELAAVESAPLRVGYHSYSPSERQAQFEERIAGVRPASLSLSLISANRGAKALQDHVDDEPARLERAETLGGFTRHGFQLTENLIELERLAELAFPGKRPRAAIVEATSIFEVALLAARRRMTRTQRGARIFSKAPRETTLKFIVNAMLPALLSFYNGDRGSLIKRANAVRELRNRVAHHGYHPTVEETNLALSTIRTIVGIFELPDTFRLDWKYHGS
ncbi:hypothetical protein [Glacieibacterium frigidum]|uniref:ApeA N-terminal domain-containing protein n=1 Tax=Glacieibacterium frigidum TaxID=2593303 RepID=A0A552UGB3_9SPHN|nr:hypothetical protein [Glacieibacterium frigidum]TRW17273.1 hypothetical protein FMM06_03555 [Glacieibacterium frigidum]